MTTARILRYLSQFLLLVIVQVMLFKDFALLQTAYAFVYVGAFLLLPFEVGAIGAMLLAFLAGLAVDMFYDTLGVHASASVLAAFLRTPLLRALTPPGGYEPYMEPTLRQMGPQWMLLFLVPLLAVHHGTLLMIEYADLMAAPVALLRAIASTVLSAILIILLQNLITNR